MHRILATVTLFAFCLVLSCTRLIVNVLKVARSGKDFANTRYTAIDEKGNAKDLKVVDFLPRSPAGKSWDRMVQE